MAIEGEHLPTEDDYDAELQSGQDPGEGHKHADELPFVQKPTVSSVVRVAGHRRSRR